MKRFMKLRRLHGKIHDNLEEKKELLRIIKEINNVERNAFILAYTPTHGNLGDHAIAFAEEEFLKKNNLSFYELTDTQLNLLNKYNLLKILNKRKILVHGGGYLGTLWPEAELMVRDIVSSCNKAQIIFLPNTIFYEEDNELRIEDSAKLINSNPNNIICLREKVSYNTAKKYYKKVMLIPDMVLSLKQIKGNEDRSGCIMCLRNDLEKTMSDKTFSSINSFAKKYFVDNIIYTDMVVDYRIDRNKRQEELNKKFSQFLCSKLVITDRLHGMIFAAVTGTPCIVLDSKSPKLRGSYEWIKNNEYIRFINDTKEVEPVYNNLVGKEYVFEKSFLEKYYDELARVIRKMRET